MLNRCYDKRTLAGALIGLREVAMKPYLSQLPFFGQRLIDDEIDLWSSCLASLIFSGLSLYDRNCLGRTMFI